MECWFLRRRTRRKTHGTRREPTTNSTHTFHRAGIESGPHWWEVSALTNAPSLLPTTRSSALRANQLLTVPPSYCNLTWHKPISTFAEFRDVTSQCVQETLGFAVSVKEPKFRHSTVGFVRMRQIGDLKK